MKTAAMTTGVVYAQARGKYSPKAPVLMIDGRRFERWQSPRYSSQAATRLALEYPHGSGSAKGALFVDLSYHVDHDADEPSFQEWTGAAIEHPAVARALAKIQAFVGEVAAMTDGQVKEFPYGYWPTSVEVFRAQTILGPWEDVHQAVQEAEVRRQQAQEAERDRLDKARIEFQNARNAFGPSALSVDLSYDGRTVTMPRSSFVALAEVLKENKS